MKNINKFIKNNIKVFALILAFIILLYVGYTLATGTDIGINIGSGNYNVVYTGSVKLPTSKLEPVVDTTITSSATNSKVLKANFTVKGASSNPTDIPIIYDVSLTDLTMDTLAHHKLLKWRLYKNNTELSSGNFSYDFDAQINKRMVLTPIQQDLPSNSSTADSYTLFIWISEECTGDVTTCTIDQDVTELMGKTISGNIKIELSTKSKKALVRPLTASKTIMNLASTSACNAGGTGVCATNSYTENGETKYHDYRYRGAEPNNYVSFNNDLYRIIGVFDSNSHGREGEYLIKLIMANPLYSGSWGVYNSTNSSGTYSSYKNDWTGNTTGVKASANVILNEYFYNKTNTSSTYGACSNWTYYFGNNEYKTFSCSDIVGYGINDTYRNYIEEVTWYLKGYNDTSYSKQNFYLCERGLSTDTTNCMSANSGTYDSTTTTNIGLMYASDYLYASSYFADTSTTTVSSYYYGTKNWLYKGYEWTITPRSSSATYAFSVNSSGHVYDYDDTNLGRGVRPTFYLKSIISIEKGSGTISDPYILAV